MSEKSNDPLSRLDELIEEYWFTTGAHEMAKQKASPLTVKGIKCYIGDIPFLDERSKIVASLRTNAISTGLAEDIDRYAAASAALFGRYSQIERDRVTFHEKQQVAGKNRDPKDELTKVIEEILADHYKHFRTEPKTSLVFNKLKELHNKKDPKVDFIEKIQTAPKKLVFVKGESEGIQLKDRVYHAKEKLRSNQVGAK